MHTTVYLMARHSMYVCAAALAAVISFAGTSAAGFEKVDKMLGQRLNSACSKRLDRTFELRRLRCGNGALYPSCACSYFSHQLSGSTRFAVCTELMSPCAVVVRSGPQLAATIPAYLQPCVLRLAAK